MTWFNDVETRAYENWRIGGSPILEQGYDLKYHQIDVPQGEEMYRLIGSYHLAPCENGGGHACHCAVLAEDGKRINNPVVAHGYNNWQGRVTLDKPDTEPHGNFTLHGNVNDNWARVCRIGAGDCVEFSDQVSGIRSGHPDEPDPNCPAGNTWGHHSFYLIWIKTTGPSPTPPTEPPPTEPPPTEPPPTEPPTGPVTLEGTFTGAGFSFTGTFRGEIK